MGIVSSSKAWSKAGTALATWHLAREYGFTDIDGRQPDMAAKVRDAMVGEANRRLQQEALAPEDAASALTVLAIAFPAVCCCH